MSNMTRWDPIREMMAMNNAMDRWMNRFGESEYQGEGSFTWDVAENDNEYVIKATLPGVKPEDIEITYSNNTLTIKGETKEDQDMNDARYHMRERRYGSYSRSVTLPSTVKSDAIEATSENGILTLRLPKTEEVKPRRIEVKGGSRMIEGKSK